MPRNNVLGDIEKQIMLGTGCPGLVLYGRRRMGKSTILNNISGFLPSSVIPVVVSMQKPQAFTSFEDFVNIITSEIQKAVPKFEQPHKKLNLINLFDFLTGCNNFLQSEGKRLLLSLDEYENIDLKIGEKVFPEDLLAAIRESIQTHRRITWIFAGSHEITELKNAPWTSYLVSVRTLEVPLFTPAETRLLLTEPLKYSTLWPSDAPNRPRFVPEFWGEGGIEGIHNEAGGWPHLVQLIAETIIDLINDEDSRQVDSDLFERALDKAIVSGHNVLYELMHRESFLEGEWEYLNQFKTKSPQPPPDDEAVRTSLMRRLLIEEENGEWRLRVPLMERWLKKRG